MHNFDVFLYVLQFGLQELILKIWKILHCICLAMLYCSFYFEILKFFGLQIGLGIILLQSIFEEIKNFIKESILHSLSNWGDFLFKRLTIAIEKLFTYLQVFNSMNLACEKFCTYILKIIEFVTSSYIVWLYVNNSFYILITSL